MQLIRFGSDVQSTQAMSVCLGCFDGIHLGHQALIEATQALAKEHHVLSACLTFEPYPKHYFAKKNKQTLLSRLMRFRDKYHQLKAQGLDRLVICPFNQALASMSAETFVHKVLLSSLNVRCVVVGEDFRFGVRRQAGVEELKQLCESKGVVVRVIPAVTDHDVRVSTTLLREALTSGDLDQAKILLGRDYSVSGCVRHGQARGRKLGFPTANVHLPPRTLPMEGVFVVSLTRADGTVLEGVANVGGQPTVDQHRSRLEVHCLNFDGDLYNEQVRVTFLQRIRGVIRFSGLPELVEQIAKDKAEAESYFAEILN